MKNAFTIIELIFVIVILGILSAVAVPKFASVGTEARITNGRSDISTIRTAIMNERQSRLIQGENGYISGLSHGTETLFDGNDSNHTLLLYGIASGTTDGKWENTDGDPTYKEYEFHIDSVDVVFKYDDSNGKFDCLEYNEDKSLELCKELVN